MSKRPPSRFPIYSDSDLNFILPNFLINEFFYARSLEKDVILTKTQSLTINTVSL